ncbi:hypothetical protein, variant 1 [Aphanomyces astaci]|uniref:Uncharacterized protein n=1 Tax=Aphanomyces astaci TaxID=112090 RepID=W4FXS6_APHAT|nr:hypothetical protein, variant 1 [Aphanomyces astaci]ETV72297.1 hypothetical protein, variant 1 [Aphanomyces astaci]|eukprot:XP_009837979.1 hypothetical protein, variant 1 [Aphanomyces astaci]
MIQIRPLLLPPTSFSRHDARGDMVRFTWRSSTSYGLTTKRATPTRVEGKAKPTEKGTSVRAMGRVASNVIAGMLLFVPLVTLVVLVTEGMLDRRVVSFNAQTSDYGWADYGKSCVLTTSTNGWALHTCDANTAAVAPLNVFDTIGQVLSRQWARELANASGTLHVTTCAMGGTAREGWANLQFIAGYDYFPECLPPLPQDVAGMAMLETTTRDDDGVYALIVYADLDPDMTPYTHTNSDGTVQKLIANPQRTLISVDGIVENDPTGENYIIYSRPLGPRYLVTGYCKSEIEELSVIHKDWTVPGWSQGKYAKHPVVTGWACGHTVSKATELIALQVVFSLCTLCLFAGDIYITLQGLQGVFTNKPVLTYQVLAGLERRKLLVAFILITTMPGLLYLDVSRIYFSTQNGFRIWCLSCLMFGTFHAFGFIFFLSILDRIPCQLSHVVHYSAPTCLYGAIIGTAVACCQQPIYETAYHKFYAASPLLMLRVFGQDWSSGSYTVDGTPPVIVYLCEQILVPICIAFVVSIVVAVVDRFKLPKSLFMSIAWCRTNSFITHAQAPNWITALPLNQTNAIKIGNKMYCKPSTQALMGFATVMARDTPQVAPTAKTQSTVDVSVPIQVVNMYALVPALWFPTLIRQYGTIHSNEFTATTIQANLPPKKYKHTRGACAK